MGRTIFAVLAGYAVWTLIWLGGNRGFFDDVSESIQDGGSFTDPTRLVWVLALSVVCSLAGGFVSAKIDKVTSGRAALWLGLALLATGVFVQFNVWQQMPVWYHVIFLAGLIPATLHGSRLGA